MMDMDGMGAMMGWMMGLGLLGWLLVIGLLVAILVVLVRILKRGGPAQRDAASGRTDRGAGEARH
jgi:hypothetical protein